MKKLIRIAIFIFIIAAAIPFTSTQASASVISERGQIAIEQIATCINSDGKDQLNIVFLIDDSGSLKYNDPTALRVQGLIQSLEQFRDVSLSKPYFTINRAITTFGHKFTVRKDWQKLDNQQLEEDVNWVKRNVPELVDGDWTDWNLGLKGVLKEFSKVKSKNSCNVLVWFTDGGVALQNLVKTRESMIEICGVDPANGKKTGGDALIDQFRSSGINIQGILLRNQEFIDDPEKVSDLSKEKAANEIARMSFFRPVIEQEGGVSGGAFILGGPSKYKCGSYSGAGGVLQIVSDPLDIIWPPVQFNCLANNGRVIPMTGGKIKVDAALTRFSVTSPSKNFSLENANGDVIATGQGAVKGDVKSKFIDASKSVIEISGNISASNEIAKPGIWSITGANLERSVFCGYLDLEIDLKVGTCYIGEKCNYQGRITRFGRPVDLGNFQSIKATSSLIDNQGNVAPTSTLPISQADAAFQSSFVPDGDKSVTNLKISLKVVTETGIEFRLGVIKSIAVIPPGLYPEITPSPITPRDFSQGLVGKSGVAKVNLSLNGPSRTNGQICLNALEVRSDVNPNRISGYVSKLDGKDLNSKPCFTLLAGSKKVAKLEVSNKESANGVVSGYMTATLKADGQEDIQTKIDVQFQTSKLTDSKKFAYLFPLLMFLGLALPLGVLAIINSRNSRIVLDNIYRASIPVVLSASGNFVTPGRIEKGKSSDLLSHEDFSPFSSGKEIVRSKQIGSEQLTGKAPVNPFGNLRAIISTIPGQVITTSAFSSSKNKYSSNQAHGALNASGLIYVTLTDSANQLLKLQNQGSTDNTEKVEGNLTALLSLNTGDPVAQVDYLNTRIMHEGGWLNNLLVISPTAKALSLKKESKRGKGKKVAQPVVPAETDDWGSPSTSSVGDTANPGQSATSSTTNTSSSLGDDWGTSTSEGDWKSPGSSNNSDSKEEW